MRSLVIFTLYSIPIFNSFVLHLMRVWIISAWASALFMFLLSFIWHSFVLADFENLSNTLNFHLIKSGVFYLLLGFLIVFILNRNKHRIPQKFFGLIVGAGVGLLFYIFILAFSDTLTRSFIHHSFQRNHLALDFIWQMFEQGIGGVIAARSILFFGSWKKSI